jgi:hypothetical protein
MYDYFKYQINDGYMKSDKLKKLRGAVVHSITKRK